MKSTGVQATSVHILAELGKGNLQRMVSWMKWHYPPDTGFKIRTPAVWDRARYLSVTKVPHNIEYSQVSGEETFCFFKV